MSPVLPIRFVSAILAAIVLAAASQAPAQTPQPADATAVLEKWLFGAPAREQFIATVLAPLRQYDTDLNGLDAEDIESVEDANEVRLRADRVRKVLINDVDGDGRVTREEVETTVRRQSRSRRGVTPPLETDKRLQQMVATVMQADSDGDNVITFDEMRAPPKAQRTGHRRAESSAAKTLLTLDPNKDGRLTAEELTKLANDTFERFDKDGSGLLSADELEPLIAKLRSNMDRPRQVCELPKPAANDQVVVFGTYEGQNTATASVVGMDRETSAGKITIEPGDKPLYIVLSSYDAMIWQFDGDTKRVSRAVVIPRRHKEGPGAGVTGLRSDQVSFLEPGSCFGYFRDVKSGKALQARAVVEHTLGRPVDVLSGVYRLRSVRLPSGQLPESPKQARPVPQGMDERLWRDFVQFNPDGVNEIDPARVVAPKPAQRYDVLPQEAGLVQLVQDGSLKVLSDGMFHIVKPIARFPAGLNGGHSVTFLLGKGISMPTGSPGHSCVISEETGEPLRPSPRCRSR